MRNLLFVLLTGITGLSFASSLDMTTLSCGKLKLVQGTTLKEVQDNCLIKKQYMSDGMFVVKFINSATNEPVSCRFPSWKRDALLNSCRG